jgi:hypothetical protein
VQINLRYDERGDADSPLRIQETRAGSVVSASLACQNQ